MPGIGGFDMNNSPYAGLTKEVELLIWIERVHQEAE